MFEKETETLEKIIRNNTIANAPAVSLRNILESNIPQNVKSYFRGEVEWLLYKERRTEKRSNKFDYGIDDIQMLQEQMDILLIYNFAFNSQDFSKTLDNCVHFLFNYLCRPQWTLENFLFDEKSVIPIRELSLKFRYCSDYSYFWQILGKHFESKSIIEISKDEFSSLIKRIDAEIIKQHNAENLAKMTEPFFTFVNYIQQHLYPTDQLNLPVKSLIYFFEDKKVSTVAKKLTSLREQDHINISYQELSELLKDFFVPQNFSLDDELAMPVQELQNKKTFPISLPDRERQSIVRHIFNNDESQFVHIVEKILSSSMWDDASLALDHYFTMNDVDPFSREAIIFTNALQSHFIKTQNGDFN
jgi:hypothetical protein